MWNYLFMLLAAGAATFLLYDDKKELTQNAIVAGVALVVSYLLFVWLPDWSGTAFQVVLWLIGFGALYMLYDDFDFSLDALKSYWKHIVVIWIGLSVVSFLCDGSSSSYDRDGYEYAVKQLRAPSTAELQSYITKSKFRDRMKEHGITYSKKVDFEVFNIEATNGFGGRGVTDFLVVYWKGKPVTCANDGAAAVWLSGNVDGIARFKSYITHSAGISAEDIGMKIKGKD